MSQGRNVTLEEMSYKLQSWCFLLPVASEKYFFWSFLVVFLHSEEKSCQLPNSLIFISALVFIVSVVFLTRNSSLKKYEAGVCIQISLNFIACLNINKHITYKFYCLLLFNINYHKSFSIGIWVWKTAFHKF